MKGGIELHPWHLDQLLERLSADVEAPGLGSRLEPLVMVEQNDASHRHPLPQP
jgi:hypothetical protein